jgi:hypothetical protein
MWQMFSLQMDLQTIKKRSCRKSIKKVLSLLLMSCFNNRKAVQATISPPCYHDRQFLKKTQLSPHVEEIVLVGDLYTFIRCIHVQKCTYETWISSSWCFIRLRISRLNVKAHLDKWSPLFCIKTTLKTSKYCIEQSWNPCVINSKTV